MRKKYSIIAIFLLISLMLSLSACGSTELNDNTFIKNMQKGLEARWKISNAQPDTYNSNTEKKDSFGKCVNAELDAIGDISAYNFENPELKELAEMYYQALQSQLEGIKYIGADDNKFHQIYGQEGYYNRARVICRLVDDFGLTVSSNYASNLDDFVSNGRVRLELDEELKAMEAIFSGDTVIESLGGTNYECIIKNTSNYDLSGAQIEFNLYNDKDVLVDTSTEYMNSWGAGSTNQCSLYISKEFTRAEARISLYSDSINDYLRTEFHPIEYVNKMIIVIKMKSSLPVEISYTSYKTITTKCKVTSFDYEVGYWSNGQASVTLKVSGKKTYDEKGDSYSRAVRIGWKLYDEKRNVVDSGTFYSSDVKVGETFTDTTSSAYHLAPGSYTLEILNVG